jgi:hypothetical protein
MYPIETKESCYHKLHNTARCLPRLPEGERKQRVLSLGVFYVFNWRNDMGFFGSALSELQSIVENGAGEHSGLLHEAIQNAESHPQELGNIIGRLSQHPEIGNDVQAWMSNPESKAILSRFDGTPSVAPTEQ